MHVTYPRRHSLQYRKGGGGPIGTSSGGPSTELGRSDRPLDDIRETMAVQDGDVTGGHERISLWIGKYGI